jgi:hypothetical protein
MAASVMHRGFQGQGVQALQTHFHIFFRNATDHAHRTGESFAHTLQLISTLNAKLFPSS